VEGGTLTFMIGGRKKVFEGVREYFLVMGKTFFYCGGQGLGLHAKLSQILANLMQAFYEGMVLATKGGVEPAQLLEILPPVRPGPG
jgi:3-hydroxyisobutyrate dehydrogenase-like beta-hydroxyacid dehydrogenase